MSNLTALSFVEYNGYQFRGPRVSSSISMRPVSDPTGRSSMMYEYSIRVETIITNEDTQFPNQLQQLGGTKMNPQGTEFISTTSPVMDDIRARLGKQGAVLRYSYYGYGSTGNDGSDTVFVVGDTYPDVAYGPRPGPIECSPIIPGVAWKLSWSCSFATSSCPQAADGQVMSFSLATRYSISPSGMTAVSYSGQVKIGLRYPVNGKVPSTTVDVLRERVFSAIPAPPGFQLQGQEWSISPDGSEMGFSIAYAEQESTNSYPEGFVRVDMNHSFATAETLAGGLVGSRWVHELSASGEFLKTMSRNAAILKLLELLKARELKIKERMGKTGETLMLTSVSASESIFSNRISISMRLTTIINPKFFQTWLWRSALGEPLSNPLDREKWQRSMATMGAWRPRGLAGMTEQPRQIVDPCSPDIANLPRVGRDAFPDYGSGTLSTFGQCQFGLLGYSNSFEIDSDTNTVQTIPAQNPPSLADPNQQPSRVSPQVPPEDVGSGISVAPSPSPGTEEKNQARIYQSSPQETVVTMTGWAVSSKQPVGVPELVSKALIEHEAQIFPIDTSSETSPIGNYYGCVLWGSKWVVRFKILYRSGDPWRVSISDMTGIYNGTPEASN